MLNFYYIDPQFLRGMAEALTPGGDTEPAESQDIPRIHFNLLMEHLTDWQIDGSRESLQDAAIALMNLYRVSEPPAEEYELELDETEEPPAADYSTITITAEPIENETKPNKSTSEFFKNLIFGVKSA